ncbi:hypothetical protein EG329_011349 [Mollisiaceae sp. DMI_Dod_QoI]|nr:hypothetical protein EG329_011349 [Helotiales sp. DMI_Dod_QoI]
MPLMETVTIINKSGKVISTGKHLVNIFKEAKEAYQDRKAELKAEQYARIKHRNTQRLVDARDEVRSSTSSRHSHRSHRSHRSHKAIEDSREPIDRSRPPLTERNLSHVSEGSVTSSRRSRSSHHGSRRPKSPVGYRNPYVETSTEIAPRAGISRRHTDMPMGPTDSALSRGTLPPPYQSQLSRAPVRSQSNPDFHDKDIDMNLAYGKLPPDLQGGHAEPTQEEELKNTMSRIDHLLLEAQCLHHSATAIISTLQANPEAMAAVALTLAELSNLLTHMSPSILGMLKASSPAVFGLLASPQFLIAGGVALGVTVVMFGGFKIIKRLQADNEAKKEANKMEEALVYDNIEMGSVESWRRGIADIEAQSVATSVDGEFITPEAARQKKERIKERRKEERTRSVAGETVKSERRVRRAGSDSGETMRTERTERTIRRVGSDTTLRKRDIPIRTASSRVAESETGRSEKPRSRIAESESGRSRRSRKDRDDLSSVVTDVVTKEKRKKSLSALFKRNKDKGKHDIRESVLSAGPLIEI